MRIVPLLIILLFFGITNRILSQEIVSNNSTTKGFSIGVHGGYLSYTASSLHFEPHTGFGFGGSVQYGFTHQMAVALSVQNYRMDPKTTDLINRPYPYTEFDLIGKYIFGSTNSRLRPFLSLGLNYTTQIEKFYQFTDPNLNEIKAVFSGLTLCGGTGISFFFTDQLSLDISGLYHLGSFGITENGDHYGTKYNFSAFKFLGGLSYHF